MFAMLMYLITSKPYYNEIGLQFISYFNFMTNIYLTDKFIQTVLSMTFDVNYCENYVDKAMYCKCVKQVQYFAQLTCNKNKLGI